MPAVVIDAGCLSVPFLAANEDSMQARLMAVVAATAACRRNPEVRRLAEAMFGGEVRVELTHWTCAPILVSLETHLVNEGLGVSIGAGSDIASECRRLVERLSGSVELEPGRGRFAGDQRDAAIQTAMLAGSETVISNHSRFRGDTVDTRIRVLSTDEFAATVAFEWGIDLNEVDGTQLQDAFSLMFL